MGGRARTDEVEGFLLDHGFQVLLTAYPEAQQVLDYDALKLARFSAGALIRYRGKFHHFVDPWRSPGRLFSTALSPIGSLFDKLRVARLRSRVCRGSLDGLFERPETTTIDALRAAGFSDQIIEPFFRPFLGGVFLDRELVTSSRMFEFVFRMFASGDAAIPARGMGALARQIADQLPAGSVQTGALVATLQGTNAHLASGEEVHARAIVVACEAPHAAKLLGDAETTSGQGVTCLYYAADRAPIDEPILVLNGDSDGPINNLCVPSKVSPTYAPPNQSLISVTVLGTPGERVESAVRTQLRGWFGSDVDAWRLLRTYCIPYALPSQAPPALSPVAKPSERGNGIYVCGDYLDTASIQGAMLSGRRAADQIVGKMS